MAERVALGKRIRFEIFKRDGFRCRYCGADPVKSVLEVDHVIAVANGGTNDPANLVTSCQACNSGKSDVPLESRKYEPAVDSAALREHTEQIREYLALQKELAEAQREAVEVLAQHWEQVIGPMSRAMYDRLSVLMREWPQQKLVEAIEITGRKHGFPTLKFNEYTAKTQAKYFHGILRNWREGR